MSWLDNCDIKKNDENPLKANGQTYNYEVTDKSTGQTEYLTQKGMDAVNNQNR